MRKDDIIDGMPLGKKKRFFIIFRYALGFKLGAQERSAGELSLLFYTTHFFSVENGQRE